MRWSTTASTDISAKSLLRFWKKDLVTKLYLPTKMHQMTKLYLTTKLYQMTKMSLTTKLYLTTRLSLKKKPRAESVFFRAN